MAGRVNHQSATASRSLASSSASPGRSTRSTTAKLSPGVIKPSAPKTHKRKPDIWKNGFFKTLGFLQSLPNGLLVFIVSIWTRLMSDSEKKVKSAKVIKGGDRGETFTSYR